MENVGGENLIVQKHVRFKKAILSFNFLEACIKSLSVIDFSVIVKLFKEYSDRTLIGSKIDFGCTGTLLQNKSNYVDTLHN